MANETIGSGGTYNRTSIANWEANLTENGTGTVMKAEATDTSTVTLDAQYTVTLTADSSVAVSAPTYANATAKARIEVASGNAIYVSGTGTKAWTISKIACIGGGIIHHHSSTLTVQRCFVRSPDDGIFAYGEGVIAAVINASNCAVVGTTSTTYENFATYTDSGTATLTAYHCSSLGNKYGFNEINGTLNAYACVEQGAATSGYTAGVGGDYNVSQDATAPGSSSTKYYRSTSGWFANTNAGFEDLSLAAGAQGKWVTDGKDAIDQTGWPSDVATDIVGTTRAAPIDPGVWQTPAAATGQPTIKRLGGVQFAALNRGVW